MEETGELADVAPTWDAFHYSPNTRTLADEIKALRSYVKRNDVDPTASYTPAMRAGCHSHKGFAAPSPELLAMQAGKPAYGSR